MSAGHGRVGKHRKHPGGRGMAGSLSHHRTNVLKFHPGYFGKKGHRTHAKNLAHKWLPAITTTGLWKLLSVEEQIHFSQECASMPILDLNRIGIYIVRGGFETPRPMFVRARGFTDAAKIVIEKNGGKWEIVNQETDRALAEKLECAM